MNVATRRLAAAISLEENMEEAKGLSEEIIPEKLRKLPSERKREILDSVDFLESREKSRGWVEFDEWATNLAKEKGFAHLTEQEVAEIVSDLRGQRTEIRSQKERSQ